jgi:thiamine kinase-like enzyme
VHGEFYPSNVIVELEPGPVARPGRAASDVRTPDRRGGRDYRAGAIRVVDWESIGIGPAALDLAALTAGDWSAAARARMVRAYRSSAPRPVAGRADFDLVVEAARLVNALQWLGWSDGWTAPPQHARDWRGEASSAARRVADAGLEAP